MGVKKIKVGLPDDRSNRAETELSSLSSSSNTASNSGSPPAEKTVAEEEKETEEEKEIDDAPKVGRPLGCTNEKKREDNLKLKKCIDEIANDYSSSVSTLGKMKRVRKGFLVDMISEKKRKYEINSDISVKTIYSCKP